MGKKQVEDAVINVVINGEKAISSFRELNQLRREQARLVETLNKNTPEYPQQQRRLEDLNAAHKVWRAEINNSTAAIDRMNKEMGETEKSGFFDKMKSMFGKGSLMVAGGNLISSGISTAIDVVKNFVSSSEEAYVEAVKGQAQLDAALKSTQGVAGMTKEALNDMAGELMDDTGIDDDVISKGEQMMLTFTNVRGKIYEQAIPAIIDMTSAMNQGTVTMEGIQAASIQVGKALNDPIKGATALAKVGVTLTEQQKEQIKTLVESNRMQDAQAIILRELSKEFGGVAKAMADTDAGAMQKFETRMGNIQETIGKWITQGKVMLVEFLSPLVDWLEKVVNYFDQASERGGRMKVFVADISKLMGELWAILKPLGKAIADAFTDTAALDVFRGLLASIVIPLKTIALVISDLRKGEFGKAFTDSIQGMAEFQKNVLVTAKNTVIMAKDVVVGLAKSTDQIAKNLDKAGKGVKDNSPKDKTEQTTQQRIATINKEIAAIEKRMKTEKAEALQKDQIAKDALIKKRDLLEGKYKAPESGGETEDQKKARLGKEKAAHEKAAKEISEYQQHLKDYQAEVNKLIAESTKGTAESLDSQLQVINDKYQKLIDRLQGLRSDKHTKPGGATDKKLKGEIADVVHAREQEKNSTTSIFKNKQIEEADKQNEEQYKSGSERLDNVFNNAQTELNNQEAADLSAVSGEPEQIEERRLAIKEIYAQKTFELEQAHLAAMVQLQTQYSKDTSALDSKIAANTIKENERAASKKLNDDKKYKDSKKQLQDLEVENIEQGAQFLQSILNKNTAAYKAALIVEKGVAAARVVLNTEASIAAYAAANAGIPFIGAGLVAAYTVAARISEGMSLALIAKQAIDGVSGSGKKYAKGGLLPDGPSHSNGGINLIDAYGRVYGNIEGGEPVLSKDTYANNRGLIDALLNSNGRQLNFDRIQDATNSRERRISNLPNTVNRTNATVTDKTVSPSTDELNSIFGALLGKMDNMASAFVDQRVVLSNRAFEENATKIVKVRNEANA